MSLELKNNEYCCSTEAKFLLIIINTIMIQLYHEYTKTMLFI